MKNFGLEVCAKHKLKHQSVRTFVLWLLLFLLLLLLLQSLTFSLFFHRQMKGKNKKLFWLLFMSTFMLLSLDGWIKFPHKKKQHSSSENFTIFFIYVVYFSFCKIKELIMEVFQSRTKLLLFLLLSIGKRIFFDFFENNLVTD